MHFVRRTLPALLASLLLSGFGPTPPDEIPGEVVVRQVDWQAVEVGMCTDYGGGADVPDRVTVLDCEHPHRAEFSWIGQLPAGDRPSDQSAYEFVAEKCALAALPGPISDFSALTPSEDGWASGDRNGFCLAVNSSSTPYSGSLASLAAIERTRWYPLLWLDAAAVLALLAAYAWAWRVFGVAEAHGIAQGSRVRELWWFVLPVAGSVYALLFPSGHRYTTSGASLPFPVALTICLTGAAALAAAMLIARGRSVRRLAAVRRRRPDALLLEGVRLPETRSRVHALASTRGRFPMPYWYPLLVTGEGISVLGKDGRSLTIARGDIADITAEFRSVRVGGLQERNAHVLDVRLEDSGVVVPFAIRSSRSTALFRLTADAEEMSEALDAVRRELGVGKSAPVTRE